MNRRIRSVVCCGLAVTAFAGCAKIQYDTGTIESVVAMNRVADPATYQRIGDFEVERRAVFVIAQLITIIDAELDEAVQRELARSGGDAIINFRIHEEYDIVDVLVSLIAGGVVNSRAVTLEGDVVTWRGGMNEEGLQRLGLVCRAIDVPEDDGSRTGHVCIPQQALALAATD